MIDWEKDCKDATWSMFWMGADRQKPNTDSLKENVAKLIRMTTQKTAGQRGVKDHVNWAALTPTIMAILVEVTILCLSGAFGPMPKEIEE